MSSVVLVDSGGANIGSVKYALARLGVEADICADGDEIQRADKVIMPGVGAAGAGMARLRENGLTELIPSLTQPVLGICLGMQLMFESSEEDDTPALNIFRGGAARLPDRPGLRVPHMGWNRLEQVKPCVLLDGLGDDAYAYFVHSFALPVNEDTVASALHGSAFCAVAQRDNFYGTQFHPERSAQVGAKILENFLSL
ncbi:MAG: imidazole glycerol phosphate synthase subunit HisH [Pseudomonadota bacterium]